MLVVYPLSIGPAVWLENTGFLSVDAIEAAYAPLIGLESETWNRLLNWYLLLWQW
jgi:hypothetical protein